MWTWFVCWLVMIDLVSWIIIYCNNLLRDKCFPCVLFLRGKVRRERKGLFVYFGKIYFLIQGWVVTW